MKRNPNQLLIRRMAVCLLALSTVVSASACAESAPATNGTPGNTTVTTEGKLYREFPLEGMDGNVIVEELEPLATPTNSFVRCFASSDIDASTDLVVRGVIIDVQEVVFHYTETGASSFDTHYSVYTVQVEKSYKSTGDLPDEIKIWASFSSHGYDIELEKLPAVGERYYWLIDRLTENSFPLLEEADLADYIYCHPAYYLLSDTSDASLVTRLIDNYRTFAEEKGYAVAPSIFELTDPDAFFTAYYDAIK